MPDTKTRDDQPSTSLLGSRTAKRLVRAYGPVLLIVMLFVLMAILVPTLDRPVP